MMSYFLSLEAPSRTLDLKSALNSNPTRLVVKWSHLSEKDFHGQPIGYNIIYYPVKLRRHINALSVNYTRNIITLTDLRIYTMYIINVSAVSSGGIGPENTIKARTGAEGTQNKVRKGNPLLALTYIIAHE